MSRTDMTRLILKPIILLTMICMSVVPATHSTAALRGAGGPLFVQVHLTNALSSISRHDLEKLLSGTLINYKQLGGKNEAIRIYADNEISDKLNRRYPGLKAIVRPFTNDFLMTDKQFLGISDVRGLRPCFKVVYIDRQLPWGRLQDDGALAEPDQPYPFTLAGAESWNRSSHISIVQTGVTAMTRAFIPAVSRSGDVLSPVKYTKAITSQADLAMTSNEVSFLDPCDYPLKDRMVFCSPIRFFRILEESGFDVIELTGNHNNDYGSRYNTASINMLSNAGMHYFGGGKNRNDAGLVRYVSIKGLTVALIGFNEVGPEVAFATETKAGAARLTQDAFSHSVTEAAAKADIVILTVQWSNEDNPTPRPVQLRYFHRAAELGATIIVSSSAHRPMGLEIYRGMFISYGLGNFLFDQMQSLNHRRGLIARHHIYGKKHISTEFIPYLIYDYSQPRILSGSAAREVMEEIFRYSIGPAFR